MKTQQDHTVRIVALENLRAMCDRASGYCHRYTITTVSRSRVHVEYSNPDEYGAEHPMIAVFPCYPSGWPQDSTENPRVILEIMRVIHDDADGEGWQAFTPILECPVLWRDSKDGGWQTAQEIEDRKLAEARNA